MQVIEESQYPPIITPSDISINSFLDEFPGGVIGRIHASDQDAYDTLVYSLSSSPTLLNPSALFEIDHEDGTLVALPRLDVGEYLVNVTVSDGKFTSFANVKVGVNLITEDMIREAIIIRFSEVSPEDFILSYRKGFIRSVRNAISVRPKDVIIISVQPSRTRTLRDTSDKESNRRPRQSKPNLDVLFAVRKAHAGFFPANTVRKKIQDHKEDIEVTTKLAVLEIVYEKCTPTYCKYGKCFDHILLDTALVISVTTDVTSFVSPQHSHKVECDCKEGYAGEFSAS